MKTGMQVKIASLELKNPVMVASGTFGYAEELKDLVDLKKLGAIVTKTITRAPRRGNPAPRTCETPSGMLNSIGLDNPGLDAFIDEKLPVLERFGVPVIVSIASESGIEEFIELAEKLDRQKKVDAIEINISCPNILHSGSSGRCPLISQDPKATFDAVNQIRKTTKKTLITKLSPNVTQISDIAMAAESAGSDAVSLINTLVGMSIDINTRSPKLAAVTGGLSGPAIRPVALRMVYEVYQKIKIPIIGMGGIMDVSSALEFIIAGASAISVGTANFVNPKATTDIIDGIKAYLVKNKIRDIKELIGSVKL
jgi:dihydroorotate dehydrogenase (NAD+) catalytic subunit